MQDDIVFLIGLLTCLAVPVLLSVFFLSYVLHIALGTVIILLFVVIFDSKNEYRVFHSIALGIFLNLLFLLIIKEDSVIALQTASTNNAHLQGLTFTSLSGFQNPLAWWSGGSLTGNGIIALISIILCLVFWILSLLGLHTKKAIQGVTLIVGSIFFIELFYAFLSPASAAQSIGWYQDATGYLPKVGQDWALVPLQMLAVLEYIFLAYSTVGLATTICASILYIEDFIMLRTGIDIRQLTKGRL